VSDRASRDDETIPPWADRYPPPAISPAEFEMWVAEVLRSADSFVDGLRVTVHDRVSASDGSYDLDATVRYRWIGLDFLVVVEAKLHTHPIKRELVQILHTKVQSLGAHKGVMFATAPFQRGALDFAMAHGIALVSVTEGRFTFETRAAGPQPPMSREEALEFGIPVYVGHCYGSGDTPDSISVSMISPEDPEAVVALLGVQVVANK
jgi:Restriction endonuclease